MTGWHVVALVATGAALAVAGDALGRRRPAPPPAGDDLLGWDAEVMAYLLEQAHDHHRRRAWHRWALALAGAVVALALVVATATEPGPPCRVEPGRNPTGTDP